MIRVLIADDHAVVREGLKQILSEVPDMVVVDEAFDGEEALRKAQTDSWDVLVLDLAMPGRSGFDILEAASEYPFATAGIGVEHACGGHVCRARAEGRRLRISDKREYTL